MKPSRSVLVSSLSGVAAVLATLAFQPAQGTVQAQLIGCPKTIRDSGVPGECLTASSTPQLGSLYPLGIDLFVDVQGRVGLGTLSPQAALQVLPQTDGLLGASIDGGDDPGGLGGDGLRVSGGSGTNNGGTGLISVGGNADVGGMGVIAIGGSGATADDPGGLGLQAFGGPNGAPGVMAIGAPDFGGTSGPGLVACGGPDDSGGAAAGVEGFGGDGLGAIGGHGVVGNGGAGGGFGGSSVGGHGVVGVAGTGDTAGLAVFADGDFGGTGAKFFIQPHPTDPSKELRFVCLEGNESGTYFRGSSRTLDGRAVIEVPEDFRLASSTAGLTVQTTPIGARADLWVERKGLNEIVVLSDVDVDFDYFVNGVRRGFEQHQVVQRNRSFVPRFRGEPFGMQYPTEIRQILVESGILNADFTPNEQTAQRLGWKLRDKGDAEWRELSAELPVTAPRSKPR